MRTPIELTRRPTLRRINIPGVVLPDLVRCRVRANSRQLCSDSIRITQRAEEGLNTSGGKRREEILQVHAQHYPLTGMRRHECADGPALEESVHRWMRSNLIENTRQNAALQFFETRLGSFDQAKTA